MVERAFMDLGAIAVMRYWEKLWSNKVEVSSL